MFQLKIASTSSSQELQDIHNFLKSHPKHTVSTKLKVTGRNNFLWGAIKYFFVKMLGFSLSLTRDEEVAKKLNRFANTKCAVFDSNENRQLYKQIYAQILKINFDAATGKAVRTSNLSPKQKRCCDLFDACFPQNKTFEQDFLDKLAPLNCLGQFQEVERIPAAQRKELLGKLLNVFPFESANVEFVKQFLLLLKQYQFDDLYAQMKAEIKVRKIELPISKFRERIPLDGEIIQVQRMAFTSLHNKSLLPDSEPVECFVLKGTDGTRFGVKIVQEDDAQEIEVLSVNGREVCVNSAEFFSRLQLDLTKIPFQNRSSFAKPFIEHLKQKDHVIALQNIQKFDQRRKKSGQQPAISNRTIVEAMAKRKANPKLYQRGIHTSSLKSHPQKTEGVIAFFGDKMRFYDLSAKAFLRREGEASLYFTDSPKKIIKIYPTHSQHSLDQKWDELVQDITILEKLPLVKGKGIGVAKIGNDEIAIFESTGPSLQSIIDNHFGSYKEIFISFYELMVDFHDSITKNEMAHFYINTSTIIASRDKQEKFHFHLRPFNPISIHRSFLLDNPLAPLTKYYEKLGELKLSYFRNNDENMKKAFYAVCEKIDVASFGLVLSYMLANTQEEALQFPNLSRALKQLSTKMIDLEPSFTEVIEKLKEILKL